MPQAQLAAHPHGEHGRREYSLEEVGLSPDAVRTRLAAYIERFSLSSD